MKITDCPNCGTWRCAHCHWARPYANRNSAEPQRCHNCGSTEGVMLPMRHRYARSLDHGAVSS